MGEESKQGPLSDDELAKELEKLTGQVRVDHFVKIRQEGLPPCLNCAEPIFKSQKFCPGCGTQNSDYDESSFEMENGATVSQVRAEEGCPETHHALRKGLRDDEDLKHRNGKMHCSECGILVDINE